MKLQNVLRTITLIIVVLSFTLVSWGSISDMKLDRGRIALLSAEGGLVV
jgi:hypothetical protein